jgi:endonuclease YncB( thermonuclease family)
MKNIREEEDKGTRRKGKVTRMSDGESVTITNNNLIRSCISSARVKFLRIMGHVIGGTRVQIPIRI